MLATIISYAWDFIVSIFIHFVVDQLSVEVTSKRVIFHVGETAWLVATASGINKNNFKYQWKRSDNKRLPHKAIGNNGAILIIPRLAESDEGQYYCVVTNEWGRSVESNKFTLTIKGTRTYNNYVK